MGTVLNSPLHLIHSTGFCGAGLLHVNHVPQHPVIPQTIRGSSSLSAYFCLCFSFFLHMLTYGFYLLLQAAPCSNDQPFCLCGMKSLLLRGSDDKGGGGARLNQSLVIQPVDHQKVSREDRVRGQRFEGGSCVSEPEEMETEGGAGKPQAPGKPRRGLWEGYMWLHDSSYVFSMIPSSSSRATKVFCLQIAQRSSDRLLVGIPLTL